MDQTSGYHGIARGQVKDNLTEDMMLSWVLVNEPFFPGFSRKRMRWPSRQRSQYEECPTRKTRLAWRVCGGEREESDTEKVGKPEVSEC